MGLSLLDKGLVLRLVVFPHEEEGKKSLKGDAPLPHLGNLEGNNLIVFGDVFFSFTRLKSSFVSMLISWTWGMIEMECSLTRILLCI